MRGPPRPQPPVSRPDTTAARARANAARMGTVSSAFIVRDVLELADEVERLRVELAQLRAAATIGLPYAAGDAADVLRAVLLRAKGGGTP